MIISHFLISQINILCCLWFALGLGWGIAGVAWGTVVAQYTGLLLSVALWLRYYRRFGRYVDLRDSLRLRPMTAFFRINGDIFLRTACIVIVYTFFTAASSGMGDTLLAVVENGFTVGYRYDGEGNRHCNSNSSGSTYHY